MWPGTPPAVVIRLAMYAAVSAELKRLEVRAQRHPLLAAA